MCSLFYIDSSALVCGILIDLASVYCNGSAHCGYYATAFNRGVFGKATACNSYVTALCIDNTAVFCLILCGGHILNLNCAKERKNNL